MNRRLTSFSGFALCTATDQLEWHGGDRRPRWRQFRCNRQAHTEAFVNNISQLKLSKSCSSSSRPHHDGASLRTARTSLLKTRLAFEEVQVDHVNADQCSECRSGEPAGKHDTANLTPATSAQTARAICATRSSTPECFCVGMFSVWVDSTN